MHNLRRMPNGECNLERFAAQQFRDFADETGRLANKQALERGKAIDEAEADIADKPQNV